MPLKPDQVRTSADAKKIVTERGLTHVKVGNPVHVTIDTYPGRSWKGEVESIAPNSGSEFSILPAQNTSGNWVKVVQRIPVRIKLERKDNDPDLYIDRAIALAAANWSSDAASSGRERVASNAVSVCRSRDGWTPRCAIPEAKRSSAAPNLFFGRRAPRATTDTTPRSRVTSRTIREFSR